MYRDEQGCGRSWGVGRDLVSLDPDEVLENGKWKINGYSGYISLHLYTNPPLKPSFLSVKWNTRHLGSDLWLGGGLGC